MHSKQYWSVLHPSVTRVDFGNLRCMPHGCGVPVKRPSALVLVLLPWEAPQPHLPYTQVLLWYLWWGNFKISFDCCVFFYYCIYNTGPGPKGLDYAALLGLWSLFPVVFHPRQYWCVPSGKTLFFRRPEPFDLQLQTVTVKCLIEGERTQDTQDKAMSMRWDSVQACFQLQNVFLSLVLFLRWIYPISKWQMATPAWLLVSFTCLLFCWHINLTYKLFPILGGWVS